MARGHHDLPLVPQRTGGRLMMDGRLILAKHIPERDFQDMFIKWARLRGWKVAHFRPARTASGGWVTAVQGDGVGFPDNVCIRGQRLVVAELKHVGKKPDPAQVLWLDAWRSILSAEVYVWTPADVEEIERVLG